MEAGQSISLVIVDDHELLRGGIRFALLSAPDIVVVGEAHHGEDALRVCLETQPNVVLMDIRLLGDMDGVDATHSIRSLCPKTQVIGLSGHTDANLVRRVIQAGAIGYIAKGASAATLVDAIRNAADGRPTLSSESLAALVQPPTAPRITAWRQLDHARTGSVIPVGAGQNECPDSGDISRKRSGCQVPCGQHPLQVGPCQSHRSGCVRPRTRSCIQSPPPRQAIAAHPT